MRALSDQIASRPCTSYELTLTEKAPSKKNSYVIRFSRSFWACIKSIVEKFRHYKQKTYWIDTSDEVKRFEELVAWNVKAAWPDLEGDLLLEVQFNGSVDTDNTLGAICDGIERSGRIKNDRQIRKIIVERRGSGHGRVHRSGVWMRIGPYEGVAQ